MEDEGGYVLESHRLALAVSASRPDADEAARGLNGQLRHRLRHRQHAGFEQCRHSADRVRARHRHVVIRLHDDEAESTSAVVAGRTRFTHCVTLPRGSWSRNCRRSSPSRSSQRILSNMVLPATSRTPPVMTSFTSPSACTPTTVIIRLKRIAPGLRQSDGRYRPSSSLNPSRRSRTRSNQALSAYSSGLPASPTASSTRPKGYRSRPRWPRPGSAALSSFARPSWWRAPICFAAYRAWDRRASPTKPFRPPPRSRC